MLAACQYDDTGIWDAVDSLGARVDSLETISKEANEEISTLQTLVTALRNDVTVNSVEKTDDGYVITFSDGTAATITNGKDGTDARQISVKQDDDGIYYWTIGGEWLTDANGNNIKAEGSDGKDAVAPQVRINAQTGMWEISTDSGETWESTGVEGKGESSVFKSVEDGNGYITVTLADGSAINLSKTVAMTLTLMRQESDAEDFVFGETKTFDIVSEGIEEISVSKPDGWKVSCSDGELTVKAPSADNTFADTLGQVCLIGVASNGACKIAKLDVRVVESEIRVLTFEDADYDGRANYLSAYDWSSLIDPEQYGGKLLYADNDSYCWYDENNTFLASEFPLNWNDRKFWSGGQAISNYADTVLTNGDYTHQLAVCHIDPATGLGGHDGSANFCVDYGYHDNSGYSAENLPYFYFKDGKERIIDHMYVTNTTYFVNSMVNGTSFSPVATGSDYVKVVATGYDAEGAGTGESEFYLQKDGETVTEWTEWDLSSLGKVLRVEFNIIGSFDNGYGLSIPAYFAYDDVAVRF